MKVDTRRLRRKLEAAQDIDPVRRAVAECGEDLLGKSLPRTPKRENELRESGSSQPFESAHGPAVEVGFDAPHAIPVHEMLDRTDEGDTDAGDDPDGKINWTTPGTGAKYLEIPWNENKELYARYVKDAMRRQIRG